MSETRIDPRPASPVKRQLAILPGAGTAEPNVIVPLEISPSMSAELPDLDIPGALPRDNPRRIHREVQPCEDTERLLNAMIGECHFLMREVAFRCIVQSPGVEDRLAFMRSAASFAETGAKVAKAVARLRHAPSNEEAMIEKTIAKWDRLQAAKKVESSKQ